MKMIAVVALALVAVALAAPVDEPIPILRSNFDQQPDGGYGFGFETGDGTTREEKGELKTVPDEDNKPREVVVVRGSFSYTDETGQLKTVNYYADETGYHADGEHIPKPARR